MKDTLETLARILGRCLVWGLALALLWFALYVSGFLCSFSQSEFGLSAHECALLSYSGISLFKVLVYVLFLIPWIAIKLELRRLSRT